MKNLKISEALLLLFQNEDYIFSTAGGKLMGKDVIKLHQILSNTIVGDFILFDNAGGNKFDIFIGKDIAGMIEMFKKEHSQYILAYRIDNVETITPKLFKQIKWQ
jgi:hypothetical protein